MKKSFFYLSLVLCALMGLTSCKSNYYQVYSVGAENAKQTDNSLVFANEDCEVFYNLWSNNGKVSFVFSNKTDKDIFINLGQTFFIKNGYATDYYQGRTYSEHQYTQTATAFGSANTTLKGHAFWNENLYQEDVSVVGNAKAEKVVKANAYAVTTKEMEIVCVPAKCYKVFSYYSVNPSKLKTCSKKKDYPQTSVDIASYTKDSSPLIFANRIAYGFTKNEVAEKHMENTFWISSIKNYSQKAATEQVPVEEECDKNKNQGDYFGAFGSQPKVRQFKIGGPDKFYQFYRE